MQRSNSSHPTFLQIGLRYLLDPWWVILLALLAFIALFVDRAAPFEQVWSNPPIGPLIHLLGLERLEGVKALHREIAARPIWSYLALGTYFYGGTLISDFAINRARGVAKQLVKLSERLNFLLGSLIKDRKLVIFSRWIARIAIVYSGVLWLGVIPAFSDTISVLLKASIGVFATWWLVRLSHVMIDHLRGKLPAGEAHETQQIFHLIENSVQFTIVLFMGILITNNLGINVNSFLVSASFFGLAVAYGANESVKDLFGAMTLFLDKPFRIGERVRIDSLEGTVEYIGLRSTRVWDQAGYLVIVPNRKIAESVVTNLEHREPKS